VPVVVALLVLVGVIGATQGWFSSNSSTTANPSPGTLASQPTADAGGSATTSPSAGASDSTPSASPSSSDDPSSPSPSSAADPAATKALNDCRAAVRAADRTVAAAETGLKHWSEHVQAQTDANVGKITATKMDGVFKRTRLAGPDDQKRYQDAVKAADTLSASCQAPAGATASVKQKLNDCAARSQAQKPLLEAAKDGMDDWKSHLAAMQRSRMGHVHDAQGVWLRAWRAAPPHIKAFKKADKSFDAPAC
jgi:hypothetical protein